MMRLLRKRRRKKEGRICGKKLRIVGGLVPWGVKVIGWPKPYGVVL